MTEQQFFDFVCQMQVVLDGINALKTIPEFADPRGLAIAATHMETAMLWVANAKK
jgi:hypothetical protein